ncbi:hypothetical protein K2173_021228 [Erythroxylum novogranatense]|uniref:Uncharacterized protein n=1 Tax=Erythroxylum novogranatense TaxID=1862640 RepID=A0AAV8TR19_9ROSI|nr:hypothetical protein K2173_021228 [Erythroxylum novogranatense]
MKFLDWYAKIAIGFALVGAFMELFMIKTGFCVRLLLYIPSLLVQSSPEVQAMKEALNPWRKLDSDARENS